jgi:hypothetical protein
MTKSNSLTLAVALAALTGLSAKAQGVIVYDNSTNYQDLRTSRGNLEVGDEINLIGGANIVTEFRFEYVYTGTSPAAQGIVRFYAKDANAGLKPGTLLLQTDPFTLQNGFHQGIVPDLNVAVPGNFIWSVEFSGINVGVDDAGLLFYNGVTQGNGGGQSRNDHWERNPSNLTEWLLVDNDSDPLTSADTWIDNFGARVIAVPEPGTIALFVGGAAVLGMAARRRKA